MSKGHLLICTAHLKFIYNPICAHISLPIIWDEIGYQFGQRARGEFHLHNIPNNILLIYSTNCLTFHFRWLTWMKLEDLDLNDLLLTSI